jgi:ABC-type glycerol-3-phosphate transport system substrate-binding protein
MQHLKWTRSKSQAFSAVFGLGMVLGRGVTKKSLENYGVHGHTTYTHMAGILGDVLLAMFGSEWAMWARMVIGWYGSSMSNAMKAVGTDAAVASGMGKGEYACLSANLRAAMVIFGPFLFGGLYNRGGKAGFPGLPFLAAGGVVALAEIAHRPLEKQLAAAKAKKDAAAKKAAA